ncbi:hypothetical protein ROG8370_01223 [Roseovarius gaetbuli]|uniref:DUF2946 domain-containing protein n=2 Tax=Roseovarius gaetbuli TaxID=1356575 RepID=A0A1X6YTF6_9RHOB|nr:hypothetical protein ROG8370_01223 [Roseovarius gaetbuli]
MWRGCFLLSLGLVPWHPLYHPMMTPFRPILALCLCALLALTSQTMAVARGAPAPAGTMVLCTGTGPVTVLVDSEGTPTGAVHICPDCALGLFHAIATAAPDAPRTATATALDPLDTTPEIVIAARSAFRARAPPTRA